MNTPMHMPDIGAVAWFIVDGMRKMFYLVTPNEMALTEEDPFPTYILNPGIPMFFFLILLEWIWCRVVMGEKKTPMKEKDVTTTSTMSSLKEETAAAAAPPNRMWSNFVFFHRLKDIIACTISGTYQSTFIVLLELVGLTFEVTAYTFVYRNFRLMTINPKDHPYYCYAFLFFAKDFGYYWFHRILHEFHTLWTGHCVHHSGEDYNMATGLRQGALQAVCGWPFFAWIALFGFPPQCFAAHAQINTLYMFWIHTDVVGRLPFGLEYILNSPMAHRMHHRPPGNQNYAGVLIIWDRMFGTYVPELVRKDLYGLGKQPNTFDPLQLNLHHWKTMQDIGKDNTNPPSWLQRLCARRIRWKWRFNPMALFEPIPSWNEDKRWMGPMRKKWDGDESVRPKNTLEYCACVAISVAVVVSQVVLILETKNIGTYDAYLAACLGLFLLSLTGRIWDNRANDNSSALLCILVLASLFYVIKYSPIANFVL